MTTPQSERTLDDILTRMDQPMTTDQVRKALIADIRFTDARLKAQRQFTEDCARVFHQWGQALVRILADRNVLTDEDLDAMAKEMAAAQAVDSALEDDEL